jgi:hypothetical protein
MNRLNQTEPATFSIFFRVGLSLEVLISLYFIATSALFVPCGGCKKSEAVKSRPVHLIMDVIFPILKDIFSMTLLLCLDGRLHLTVPSMNRLNQPSLQHFSILPRLGFL